MLERFIGAYLFQPAAFDYSGDTCTNACVYCFANINKPFRKGNLKGAIKKIYKNPPETPDERLWADGYPVCVSNRSDPFTERNWRDTLAFCSHLVNFDNGVYLQTKTGPGLLETLDVFGDKKPIVYITVTTINEKTAKRIEPNAPTPERRLKTAEDLAKLGYMVIVAVNPCAEQWMPLKDLEILIKRLQRANIRHFVVEKLDMSRNRIKSLSQAVKEAIGEDELKDCLNQRVKSYTRDVTQYAVAQGMSVCKKGMPFASTFPDDVRAHIGKTMPLLQDFVNYCFEKKPDGGEVRFGEYDRVLRQGRGGVFEMEVQNSSIKDYLLRSGFQSWKDNKKIATHHDLLRITWNDRRSRLSIQNHCSFRVVGRGGVPLLDKNGDKILYFSKTPYFGKEVMSYEA